MGCTQVYNVGGSPSVALKVPNNFSSNSGTFVFFGGGVVVKGSMHKLKLRVNGIGFFFFFLGQTKIRYGGI